MRQTSTHWVVVRKFVQQVRTDAHELCVERSMIEEILQLCDELGTECVMDMITHEKRVMEGAPITHTTYAGAFWAAKDAQDERDFERRA